MRLQSTVRILRRNQTPQEQKLWYLLRDRRFNKFKFRRQVSIDDRFIVDFCCFDKKLVIEVDGGQHNMQENRQKDIERDVYLRQQGFNILRFWNSEIDSNLTGVFDRIYDALNHPSSGLRPPSPARGEGK